MNADETERQLRELFHEQRNEDARLAPAFHRVASRRPTPPMFVVRWWRLAPAAALAVAIAVSVAVFHRPTTGPSIADLRQWAALSNWQASTDKLLTVSSTPWGSKISAPTDSWIEKTTMSATNPTN